MNCNHCGAGFVQKVSRQRFCSVACRSNAAYRREPNAHATRTAAYAAKHPANRKYLTHLRNATARGIPWEFTFQTWMDWWGDDFDKRGSRRGQLVMARRWDTGPYSPNNCIKTTCSANVSSAHRGKIRQRDANGRYLSMDVNNSLAVVR